MSEEKHTPTERPWEATHFCKEDGTPIETVEDVIATMGASATRMETPVLYGVTEAKDDYKVICYTGNGPKGLINAQLIAHASNRYEALIEALNDIHQRAYYEEDPSQNMKRIENIALTALQSARKEVEG